MVAARLTVSLSLTTCRVRNLVSIEGHKRLLSTHTRQWRPVDLWSLSASAYMEWWRCGVLLQCCVASAAHGLCWRSFLSLMWSLLSLMWSLLSLMWRPRVGRLSRGPLCPRHRRKDCVVQDRLLAEPQTVPEFVRRRALTTLHRSSTTCPGSLHHTDTPAAGLTSLLLSFTFGVYCPSTLLSPAVYPAFILQHSTTTANDPDRFRPKWPLVDPSSWHHTAQQHLIPLPNAIKTLTNRHGWLSLHNWGSRPVETLTATEVHAASKCCCSVSWLYVWSQLSIHCCYIYP